MQEIFQKSFSGNSLHNWFLLFYFASMIPVKTLKKRGPAPKYNFDIKPGQKNGIHLTVEDSEEKEKTLASIKVLCRNKKKIGKVFSCYRTETGVFYWREK